MSKYEINKFGKLGVVTHYSIFEKSLFKDFSYNYEETAGLHGLRVNNIPAKFEDFVYGCYNKEVGEKYHLNKKSFEEAQMLLMSSLAEKALEHLRPSEA